MAARLQAWVGLLTVLSLIAPFGFGGAASPLATPNEDPVRSSAAEGVAAAYVDRLHRFQMAIPSGWETIASAGGPVLYIVNTNASAGISIESEPWCGASPTDAVALLRSKMTPDFFSGLQVLEPPTSLSVHGQVAAATFFRHYTAEGAALQKRAVVLAPDWALAWTFSGMMNNASATYLGDTINATFGTFEVLPGPAPTTVASSVSHFSLTLPAGWTSELNATVGTEIVDVRLTHPELTGTIIVVSEPRPMAGTVAEARQILQGTLDDLSTKPGFRILEPVAETSVDGHPAASAVISHQPSTYDVYQAVTVVVGAEWSLDWALIGTMFSWEAMRTRACVNTTLASMDIAPSPPAQAVTGVLVAYSDWVLAGAVAATAIEGTVLGLLIARQTRRRRP